MLRTIWAGVLTALGVLHVTSPASAQALPSFREVDFIYAQQPELFQDLWHAAKTRTVRVAVLGDSQETSPNSHGFQYIPLLNYEMWKRYGNSPETPVVGCTTFGTTPPGHWLLAGVCGSPGPTATRLSANQILPNARPRAFSTLNAATNVTAGSRGQLTMLQHDAVDVDSSAGIPTNVSYFKTSGVVKAQIFAATHASSGEIAYQARPNDAPSPSYSAAVTTAGTIALGLQSSAFAIRSGETSTLDFNGKRYVALEVFGTSDSALTDLIGLRFVNETHPQGVVVDTFSVGGYTAAAFLNDHADAGAMFNAFGFHAAILHYGANEGSSLSAAQFQSNITAAIARVRAWVGDPAFPIVLVSDVYHSRLTTTHLAQYDRYVGAQLAIAQADPSVMVINARRLTENLGWSATNGQAIDYLNDGIHYTGRGARTLAAVVSAAMMGEIHASGCPSDSGTVALQSNMTLLVELGGTSACTEHGQLRVAQSLALNRAVLRVKLTDGFTPTVGDRFKILSFGSIAGSFGSMTLPTLPAGFSWDTRELYTTGNISVATTTDPPSDPPTIPAPPTIDVTSGASQSVTLPTAPSPIAFTLNGSGALTVTARSSNTTLLPDASVTITPGCGTQTTTCVATASPTAGQTGNTTVSLTVADAHGQSATATATLIVSAAAAPDTGAAVGGTAGGGKRGGGGSFDPYLILLFALLMAARAVGIARSSLEVRHD